VHPRFYTYKILTIYDFLKKIISTMKGWFGTLLLALLLVDGLAQTMDTVFLAGQAPIVGELKRIRYGTLHFKGENLGNLEIDLTHVHTLRAYGYGYRIQTAERQFVVGVFIPQKDPGKVTVYDGFENRDFEVRNLNEVQLIHQRFFRRMEGRAGAGYSFSRGSEIGRWNGDFVLEYDTERLWM
jgi:hypothetical protein